MQLFVCFLHSHICVIPAFTWILTLAILLAHTVIQPITSLLTLLKGILLVVTVIDFFILLLKFYLPVELLCDESCTTERLFVIVTVSNCFQYKSDS